MLPASRGSLCPSKQPAALPEPLIPLRLVFQMALVLLLHSLLSAPATCLRSHLSPMQAWRPAGLDPGPLDPMVPSTLSILPVSLAPTRPLPTGSCPPSAGGDHPADMPQMHLRCVTVPTSGSPLHSCQPQKPSTETSKSSRKTLQIFTNALKLYKS